MNRAALYIRVSTLEQAQEGYSVGEQKERLIAYCKAKDWIIADIYVDGGYTGSNLNRPGIQKLISETDKFDLVLVYKLGPSLPLPAGHALPHRRSLPGKGRGLHLHAGELRHIDPIRQGHDWPPRCVRPART